MSFGKNSTDGATDAVLRGGKIAVVGCRHKPNLRATIESLARL